MDRQHQYKPGITAQIGNLREGHVSAPPQVEGAGAGILKAAMALGGEVMNVVAKDYAREMRGRMDDSILRVNAEFEKWKTEYKRTRQGVDALSAQKDFADKYAELSRQTLGSFGGNSNEIYLKSLERRLALENFHVLQSGGTYQLQQDEAWQNSILAAQKSALQRAIDENPYDMEWLHVKANEYLQSYQSFFAGKGKDIGAERDAVQEMLANTRLNAFLARAENGDAAAFNAACEMLGGAFSQGESSLQRGRVANTRGMDAEVISLIRQIAPKYGMDPELMLAISRAESGGKVKAATSKAGAVGPMQLIPKWAKKAGFAPYDLRQNIEGGISEFAQLMKKYGNEKEALIAYNWGLGNWDAYKKTGKGYYGQERPAESLQYVSAVYRHIGGKTAQGAETGAAQGGVPGLTSVQAAVGRHKLEAIYKIKEQEAQTAFVAGTAQRLAHEIGQLPKGLRENALQLGLAEIADPKTRHEVEKIATESMKEMDDAEKARSAAQAYALIGAGRRSGESVSEFLMRVNRANIGEEGKKLAVEGFQGKLEDNEITQTALNNLLAKIDLSERRGEPITPNDIYKFALDNRLTNEQTKTALQYLEGGGNLHGLKLSDVKRVYTNLQAGIGKREKDIEMPAWLFQGALEEFKNEKYAGKKIDEKTLRNVISVLLTMGTGPGWFGWTSSMERGRAMAEGKLNEWKPGGLPKVRGERDGDTY